MKDEIEAPLKKGWKWILLGFVLLMLLLSTAVLLLLWYLENNALGLSNPNRIRVGISAVALMVLLAMNVLMLRKMLRKEVKPNKRRSTKRKPAVRKKKYERNK
ncbi:MAG: hypothetical protein PHN20_02665 [Bacteroidales bacterium]|jgi:membrane protein implicated in regulation of membrane protease activity|nr:hypothetical protein [Bacteroidales bacterium]HKL92959.1 hypothetical protein [Bacteroidales bacterium]